jgi:hypothetical protein
LIPSALMAIRGAYKRDIGMSPYEMRFGSKMKLPIHLDLPVGKEKTLNAMERRKVMELVWKLEDEQAEKEKMRYDKDRHPDEYQTNDLVWLKNDSGKSLEPKWIGPFAIEEKVSELNYKIKEHGGKKLNGRHPIINIKRMKPYRTRGDEELEKEWKVEAILEHRKKKMKYEFKVKWNDLSETWEPFENLVDDEDGERTYNDKLREYIFSRDIKELIGGGGGVL